MVIQFSFYVFVTHLLCIIYLMNSGEDFIKLFAKNSGLSHMLFKVQFFIMGLCYTGLAYSCVANNDLYVDLLRQARAYLSYADYSLAITLYVVIHVLWCTHFLDLAVRAHIHTHSKSGKYETAVTRMLQRLCGFLSLKSKKYGN